MTSYNLREVYEDVLEQLEFFMSGETILPCAVLGELLQYANFEDSALMNFSDNIEQEFGIELNGSSELLATDTLNDAISKVYAVLNFNPGMYNTNIITDAQLLHVEGDTKAYMSVAVNRKRVVLYSCSHKAVTTPAVSYIGTVLNPNTLAA